MTRKNAANVPPVAQNNQRRIDMMDEKHPNDKIPAKADFDPKMKTHTCKRCGINFDFPVADFGGVALPVNWCDECEAMESAESDARAKAQREQVIRLEREAHYNTLCPKWPEPTDINRIPAPRQAVDRVLSWQYNPKGLILKGGTGQGKTRTIWLLLRRLIVDELRDVEIIKCVALAERLSTAASESMAEHGKLMRRFCRAEILFLDDLGKQRFTDRHETDLFSIIDERSENGLPTLITTRYNSESLAAKFTDAMTGRDIVRRLSEFYAVAPFGDGKEGTAATQPPLSTAFGSAQHPAKVNP